MGLVQDILRDFYEKVIYFGKMLMRDRFKGGIPSACPFSYFKEILLCTTKKKQESISENLDHSESPLLAETAPDCLWVPYVPPLFLKTLCTPH